MMHLKRMQLSLTRLISFITATLILISLMYPIFYGWLLPYTVRHLLPVRTLLTAPLVIPTTPVIPVHLALLVLTIPTIPLVLPVHSVHLTGVAEALEEAVRPVAGNVSITFNHSGPGPLSFFTAYLLVEYLFNRSKILDT